MEELSENREQTLEEIFQDVQTVVKTFEEKYNVKIPVFVAGGVYTGYDVKKFTDMGAQAHRLQHALLQHTNVTQALHIKSVISM